MGSSAWAHRQIDVVAGVAAGGALGAPARYGLGLLVPGGGDGFPWGTFAVNISGSLALAVLVVVVAEVLDEAGPLARRLRSVLGVGFLGAYTTYSSYALEVDTLARDGHAGMALLYASVSLVAGVAAAAVGLALARRLLVRGTAGRS